MLERLRGFIKWLFGGLPPSQQEKDLIKWVQDCKRAELELCGKCGFCHEKGRKCP